MTETRTAETMACAICLTNPAITKGYWAEGDMMMKLPSCGPCLTLSDRSVRTLMAKPQAGRLKAIKRWWVPEKRATTLKTAYPSVDWTKVRISGGTV